MFVIPGTLSNLASCNAEHPPKASLQIFPKLVQLEKSTFFSFVQFWNNPQSPALDTVFVRDVQLEKSTSSRLYAYKNSCCQRAPIFVFGTINDFTT